MSLEHAYLAWMERAKYVHLIPHSFTIVLFRTHSLHCQLEKLNTTVGLPPTYVEIFGSLVEPLLLSDRYSWVLVSVSVSKDPAFYYYFFDCAYARTNIENANCRKH